MIESLHSPQTRKSMLWRQKKHRFALYGIKSKSSIFFIIQFKTPTFFLNAQYSRAYMNESEITLSVDEYSLLVLSTKRLRVLFTLIS